MVQSDRTTALNRMHMAVNEAAELDVVARELGRKLSRGGEDAA